MDAHGPGDLPRGRGDAVVHVDAATEVDDPHQAVEEGDEGDRELDQALAALDTIRALGFTQPEFALRRGDPDFRLAVNRALATTYRSGEIVPIFDRWFSPFKPSEVLIAIYGLNSMEE